MKGIIIAEYKIKIRTWNTRSLDKNDKEIVVDNT